jgi:hypothetical protein
MNCESARKELSLFLYGELSFQEEEALEQHLEGCEGCRQALVREQAMHRALDLHEAGPPPDLLAQCRRDFRLRLESHREQREPLRLFWDSVQRFFAAAYMRPAGALALIAVGFFIARLVPSTPSGAVLNDASLAGPVATQVRYLQPQPSGNVRIVLDETRQRVLSGNLEDHKIRRLLLAAAKDSSDPGLRVESLDILRTRAESEEVRKALLSALQHDPNAGVRLKAMEGLRSFTSRPEVRGGLAEALLSDDNSGVRTQAIDLLIQHKEIGMAGVLQELLEKEDNNYIRLRCRKALLEMNASLETF